MKVQSEMGQGIIYSGTSVTYYIFPFRLGFFPLLRSIIYSFSFNGVVEEYMHNVSKY